MNYALLKTASLLMKLNPIFMLLMLYTIYYK
jgi:hypothetical protein